MNFDLHPGIEVMVVVGNFSILAIQTLALFSTFFTCPKALAIVFAALRFFASTPFHGHKGWNPLKTARMPIVGHLLGFVYGHLAAVFVAATKAQAFLVT